MAYKLQRHFGNCNLTIYEKNPAVSGTWYENRYPGYVLRKSTMFASWLGSRCACDVPSHNYTWSFEPKLDWFGVYASSAEIYFNGFANKYRLKDYIKTEHQVVGDYWNNANAVTMWRFRISKPGKTSPIIVISWLMLQGYWTTGGGQGFQDFTITKAHYCIPQIGMTAWISLGSMLV